MITTTADYILFAHSETQKSVPFGIKKYWIRGLNAIRSVFLSHDYSESQNFIERLLDRFLGKTLNNFMSINLELQAIHNKLVKQELIIEEPRKDYEIMKNIIELLTKADDIFMEIDYFRNETLKAELKSSLRTSYKIEAKLKRLVYKNQKPTWEDKEFFQALAAKSKESLLRAI